MCAELCNNVNRFEGMKYGYHTEKYQTIDELYTKSRTEAFGYLTKAAILYGSEVLATGNYERCYDKSLRIRRLVSQAFESEFASKAESGEATGQTAVLLPACAKRSYGLQDVQANPYLAFEENRFTAPAAITGLPALVAGGVQLVGPAFSDAVLLRLAGSAFSADNSPADSAGKEA
jgi:aspartyl-tRNA(Asn)/glutamyl-tRNA(Gln) amidotransferase subunit A